MYTSANDVRHEGWLDRPEEQEGFSPCLGGEEALIVELIHL